MSTPLYDATATDLGHDPLRDRRDPWSFADAMRRIEHDPKFKKKMRAERQRIANLAKIEWKGESQ